MIFKKINFPGIEILNRTRHVRWLFSWLHRTDIEWVSSGSLCFLDTFELLCTILKYSRSKQLRD